MLKDGDCMKLRILENERKGLSSFPVPSSAVKGLISAFGNAKEKQNLNVALQNFVYVVKLEPQSTR